MEQEINRSTKLSTLFYTRLKKKLSFSPLDKRSSSDGNLFGASSFLDAVLQLVG